MAGAVDELVASVRSNLEVIRDAMKDPMTADSHGIVSELMLDVKQSQEQLQKRASEMVESGNFANTSEIFETIDLVTNVEPQFEAWSKRAPPEDQIGASIHVAETAAPKKKKKKKKNNDDEWEAFPTPAWPPVAAVSRRSEEQQSVAPQSAVPQSVAPQFVVPQSVVPLPAAVQAPQPAAVASGRLTLGLGWDALGPLLGDPGSTDEVRRSRLGELMREAIATECGIAVERIHIRGIC